MNRDTDGWMGECGENSRAVNTDQFIRSYDSRIAKNSSQRIVDIGDKSVGVCFVNRRYYV